MKCFCNQTGVRGSLPAPVRAGLLIGRSCAEYPLIILSDAPFTRS
jgi:hypothetical protein